LRKTEDMKRTVTLLSLAAAVTAAAIPATADAKHGTGTRVSGACSGAAVSKLKAAHENGKIEVEFEVDSNRRGQSWQVVIKRGSSAVYRATKTTKAPSGSFTSRKITRNGAGVETISARATGPGGQVCTAKLRI
jgi:hypothetical protein